MDVIGHLLNASSSIFYDQYVKKGGVLIGTTNDNGEGIGELFRGSHRYHLCHGETETTATFENSKSHPFHKGSYRFIAV